MKLRVQLVVCLLCLIWAPASTHAFTLGLQDVKDCEENAIKSFIHQINTYEGSVRPLYDVFSLDEPLSAVGRITSPYLGRGGQCNGTIFKDKRILITNAHCAFDSKLTWEAVITPDLNRPNIKKDIDSVTFTSANKGKPIRAKFITAGAPNYGARPGQDYAIFLLDTPFPQKPLERSTESAQNPSRDFTMVGFSGDIADGNRLAIEPNCEVNGSDLGANLVSHYCSGIGGSSGAPIGLARFGKNQFGYDSITSFSIAAIHKGGGLKKDGTQYTTPVPKSRETINAAIPIEAIEPTVDEVLGLLRQGKTSAEIINYFRSKQGIPVSKQ